MIEMTYYNDHKEKIRSHEISIRENDFYNIDMDVWTHNPLDVVGYGSNKEEAIKDFVNKFKYVMDELKAFENMLICTDTIIDNIIEVDCLGKAL